MHLKIVAALLFATWLTLVLLGKGGLVHIILLNSIGVAMVDIMINYRTHLVR